MRHTRCHLQAPAQRCARALHPVFSVSRAPRACAPLVRAGATSTTGYVLPASPLTAAQLEQLCAWSKSKGANVDKLAIGRPGAGAAGVLEAARDCGAGDALLSVPEAAWLTPLAAAAQTPSAVTQAVSGLEPWVQLALLLIHAQQQLVLKDSAGGAGSARDPYVRAWQPYLEGIAASLTSSHSSQEQGQSDAVAGAPWLSCPLLWPEPQQRLLAGTQLADTLAGYR
jgi:hypothetical protein